MTEQKEVRGNWLWINYRLGKIFRILKIVKKGKKMHFN